MACTLLQCLPLWFLLTSTIVHSSSLDSSDLESELDLDTVLTSLSSSMNGTKYVYVGDSIEISCMAEKKWNSESITFGFSQPRNIQAQKLQCLDQSNVKIIDQKWAMLQVKQASISDDGEYSCYAGDSPCSGFLGAIDVSVEYPPQMVTNVSCVVNDWLESMHCSWDNPINYIHQNVYQLNVAFENAPESGGRTSACPLQTATSCDWRDVHEFKATPSYFLEITVTISSPWEKQSLVEIFHINTTEIVKPSPVMDLKVIQLTENEEECLVLSWSHGKKSYGKVYRVWQEHEGENIVLKDDLEESVFKKCGYKPATKHKFVVECYPLSPYSGFWSEPKTVTFVTREAKPSQGPDVTNGSYTSTLCSKEHRNITILWGDVKKEARNGDITDISLWVEGQLRKKVPSSEYSETLSLPCGQVGVDLFSHNKAGKSLVPSALIIPASPDTGVPESVQNTFYMEFTEHPDGTQTVNAVWQKGTPLAKIFWCKRLLECEGPVFWRDMLPDQISIEILSNIASAEEYLYGISVKSEEKNTWSQIFWTDCLTNKGASKIPVPKNFDLEPQPKGIGVRWSLVECSYKTQVRVDAYMIKYHKESSDEKESKVVQVDRSTSFYKVKDLEAHQPYLFQVQTMSRSQFSATEWKKAKPSDEDDNDNMIIGISVAVVVVVIVILLAIFCPTHAPVSVAD